MVYEYKDIFGNVVCKEPESPEAKQKLKMHAEKNCCEDRKIS